MLQAEEKDLSQEFGLKKVQAQYILMEKKWLTILKKQIYKPLYLGLYF